MKAQEIAVKIGLVKSTSGYECYLQNEISNDDLIDLIQEEATSCHNDKLFIFSDGSCINRQDDEYFINDDADMLSASYLSEVGFI